MKVYVQLGRYGDIMTMLPILWMDNQAGQRSAIMVAEEFASLLEGISYADVHVYHGSYHEIGQACEQAEKIGQVVCTQINGPPEVVKEFSYEPAGQPNAMTTSFQKEMWKLAGRLKDWDACAPLVFDRRDKARERMQIVADYYPTKMQKEKPLLLLSLGGTTSPFPYRDMLTDIIHYQFAESYHVVRLDKIHAHRLYDLLGLFELASLLICSDSAPLHLARAVPELPVVAFTKDTPLLWNGSSWRPQHLIYCRYADFPARYSEIMHVLKQEIVRYPEDSRNRRMMIVYNAYDDAESRRFTNNIMMRYTPIEPGACGRDSKILLKDEKRVPYLKDSLRMGLQRARDQDWVMLTRPGCNIDVQFMEDLLRDSPSYAYRMVKHGDDLHYWPIVDAFVAKRPWWKKILDGIPDLLLGSDYQWSHAMWAIFYKNGARQLPAGTVWRYDPKA